MTVTPRKGSNMIVLRTCDCCQEEYEDDGGLFCSRSCASRSTARRRQPNTTCYWCQKPLYRKPGALVKSKYHFCNRECQIAAKLPRNDRDIWLSKQEFGAVVAKKDDLVSTSTIVSSGRQVSFQESCSCVLRIPAGVPQDRLRSSRPLSPQSPRAGRKMSRTV